MANNSITTIHISRISDKFISDGEISQSQFENGLDIHKKLQENFKSSKWVTDTTRTNGLYGLFLDQNYSKLKHADVVYFGSTNAKNNRKIKRTTHYSYAISRVFKSGDLSTIKGQLVQHCAKFFEKILSKDRPLQYIVIFNLGYNPKIVEGALKIAEIISNRTIFPDLTNRKFECEVDDPALRHIFSKTDDS